MKYCVVTFANTHSAMSTQKWLDGIVPYVVMPTLREISKSCGISIRVSENDIVKANQIIAENLESSFYKIYNVEAINGKNTISEY